MSHPQIHWNPLKMQKIKLIYQIQILQILAEKVWGTFSKNRGLLIEEIPKPSDGGGGGLLIRTWHYSNNFLPAFQAVPGLDLF